LEGAAPLEKQTGMRKAGIHLHVPLWVRKRTSWRSTANVRFVISPNEGRRLFGAVNVKWDPLGAQVGSQAPCEAKGVETISVAVSEGSEYSALRKEKGLPRSSTVGSSRGGWRTETCCQGDLADHVNDFPSRAGQGGPLDEPMGVAFPNESTPIFPSNRQCTSQDSWWRSKKKKPHAARLACPEKSARKLVDLWPALFGGYPI